MVSSTILIFGYDKALQLDPACAVAAQGLAIIIAEDTLGSFGTAAAAAAAAGQGTPEEHQKRANIAREALDIFGKVRESISDGSVYVNMGHCYYARDEFARAIESVNIFLLRGLSWTWALMIRILV